MSAAGCIWLTGLPAAGKTTLGRAIVAALQVRGRAAVLLDGDELRRGPNADLGFSAADRALAAERTAQLALEHAARGTVAVVALVSPYRSDRDGARARLTAAGLPFAEVHVDTPLAVCEARDPKGLYERARRGELHGLTGVDDVYERPPAPDFRFGPATAPADAARAIADAVG